MACTCTAYKFPHRTGGGACFARQPGPYCGACNRPAAPVRRDFGIGHHDAWGNAEIHSDVRMVSRCCGAEMFEDAGLTIEHQ